MSWQTSIVLICRMKQVKRNIACIMFAKAKITSEKYNFDRVNVWFIFSFKNFFNIVSTLRLIETETKTRIPAVFEKKTKIAKMSINKVIFTVLTWTLFVCFLDLLDQRYSQNSTGETVAPLNYVGMWFIDFWLLLIKCFIHEIWAKSGRPHCPPFKMFSSVYSSEMSN